MKGWSGAANGRFGLLVDPDDVEALAQAIRLQVGPDPCLPGDRAGDYDAQTNLAAACALIVGAAHRPAPGSLWALRSGQNPAQQAGA